MATKASITKKLGRVRPPRVHITCEVEKGGAMVKREIPFVVGVMADLSGKREEPLPKMRDRKFVDIDRDHFNEVLAKQKPRLIFKVNNKLGTGKELLPVELKFEKLSDFEPQNVARQVKDLRALLELRTNLTNLRSSLFGNDKLEELLQKAIAESEAARRSGATSDATERPAAAGEESQEKRG